MVKDKIIDSIKSKTAHIYQQPPDSTTNPLILFTILSPLSVVWKSKLKGNKFNILVIFNISGYEYFGCGMVFVVKRAGLWGKE